MLWFWELYVASEYQGVLKQVILNKYFEQSELGKNDKGKK